MNETYESQRESQAYINGYNQALNDVKDLLWLSDDDMYNMYVDEFDALQKRDIVNSYSQELEDFKNKLLDISENRDMGDLYRGDVLNVFDELQQWR